MAARRRTKASLQQAYDLVQAHGGNVTQAAKAAGIPISTLQHAYDDAKRLVSQADRLPVSVDECFALLDHWLGRKRTPVPKPPKYKAGKTHRFAIAGDFHSPFFCPESVAALIDNEGGKADTLIINGDLMDGYSISRFIKSEHVPMEQEIAATDALLAQLARAFSDIVIVDGNHDQPRFEKQIRSLLSPDMMHTIEFLTGGNLSVIRALSRRYSNVRFDPLKVGRHTVGWATQQGDLLAVHAEKYSKVPGAALRAIDEWFTDQQATLGIKPYRVIVQAHTHMAGWMPWESDKVLVEGCCMCPVHGYQLSARIAGRGQRRGYVTLEQQNGVTDLDSVRVKWLDPVLRQVGVIST